MTLVTSIGIVRMYIPPTPTEYRINNRTILRRILAITYLGSSLLWVGCNEGDPSPSGPSGNAHKALLNACSLLTPTEAAAVMGQSVLVTRADTINYSTFCTYEGGTAAGSLLPTHVEVRYSVTGKIVDTTTVSFEGCKSAALSAAARI